MSNSDSTRRKTMFIFIAINFVYVVSIVIFMFPSPSDFFINAVGLGESAPILGWILAAIVIIIYTTYTLWTIPFIRTMIFEFSWLRLLSIPLAILSGIVEEVFLENL